MLIIFYYFCLYIMEEIIHEVYESNSGTAYEVYKDAVKIDSIIRLKYVKYYLDSREPVQTHFNIRNIVVVFHLGLGTNSKYILWMCLREMVVMVLDMDSVLLVISQKRLVSYLLKTDHPQK